MKKILWIGILVLVLSGTSYAATFSDMEEGDWYYEDATYLASLGIINGYPDQTFRGGERIQVDAFIKMVVTGLGYSYENGSPYWASPFIEQGLRLGLFEEDTFSDYTRLITRGEMASIIKGALAQNEPLKGTFHYRYYFTDYYVLSQTDLMAAPAYGIIGGYPDGRFAPAVRANRAEAATIITRWLVPERRLRLRPYEDQLIDDRRNRDLLLQREPELLQALEPLMMATYGQAVREENIFSEGRNLAANYEEVAQELMANRFSFELSNTSWYGDLSDAGLPSGRGVLAYSDGSYLYGNFDGLAIEGIGFYKRINGDTFVGSFDGLLFVEGFRQDPQGTAYLVSYGGNDYSQQVGPGAIEWSNGERFYGNYINNRKEGFGKFIFSSGAIYIGNFSNNLIEGKGYLRFLSGNSYYGNFDEGFRSGKGTQWQSNGIIYTGSFEENDFADLGRILYEDRDQYIGEAVDNTEFYRGAYIFNDGITYEGLFMSGYRLGSAGRYYIEGEAYEEFARDHIDALTSQLTADMTLDERIWLLYNYLAGQIEYDLENYQLETIPNRSFTAYGALQEGLAVCQGYAESFNLLAPYLGIESYMVIGDAGTNNPEGHAWNYVRFSDDYYYVDLTWDDLGQEAGQSYYRLTYEEISIDHLEEQILKE